MAWTKMLNTVNEATKDVKRNMNSFGCNAISEETVELAVGKILETATKDEKHFVNMMLLLHLNYPELEPIYEDPGDFVYLIPTLTFPGLASQMYCRLVVRKGLIHHFMQMVSVLYKKQFIQELTVQVIDIIVQEHEECTDVFPYVLFMLAKLCRLEMDKNSGATMTGDFYLNQFCKFLKFFCNKEEIPRFEKLSFLMRLAGVSCMKSADYVGSGSDLVELIEEWSYDFTYRVASDTVSYFKQLFNETGVREELGPMRAPVFDAITAALTKMAVTDEEEKNWLELKKTSRITWIEFIGVHAFLTKSLLQKYSAELSEVRSLADLLAYCSKWADFKLKLTREDFQGEIEDFGHFYKVIRRFGHKERDRKILLPQFLKFSYDEVFLSKDGLRIAEKYLIPGAEFDVALEYIVNSLNVDSMPENCKGSVPEMTKLVALKLLCSNPEVRARKEELVAEVFKDGIHSHFALSDFIMTVNQVCAKVGSIEKEVKDLAQIKHNEDLIFNICFQNPQIAVESLMKHSMRSQQYKVLRIAKPFLILPSGPVCSVKTIPLGKSCFEKIIDSTDEEDKLFEAIIRSIPDLVSNEVIKPNDLYEILTKKMNDMLTANTLRMEKVSKVYSMILELTTKIISRNREIVGEEDQGQSCDEKLIKDILTFSVNETKFSYHYLNNKTYKTMLEIRQKSRKIQNEVLSAKNFNIILPDFAEEMREDPDTIKRYPLISIGFFFIRVASVREHIKTFLAIEENKMDFKHGHVVHCLLLWVFNSDPEDEWPVLIEFMCKLLHSPKNPAAKGPLDVVNDATSGAHECSVLTTSPFVIRQYLKFYKDCINTLFRSRKLSVPDQLSIFETLVTLVLYMNITMKKRRTQKEKNADETSLQQVFLLMLDALELVVAQNPDFESSVRDSLLDIVTLMPKVQGKSEPIQRCIAERILKYEKAKMLPLPAAKETHQQALLERTAAAALEDPENGVTGIQQDILQGSRDLFQFPGPANIKP